MSECDCEGDDESHANALSITLNNPHFESWGDKQINHLFNYYRLNAFGPKSKNLSDILINLYKNYIEQYEYKYQKTINHKITYSNICKAIAFNNHLENKLNTINIISQKDRHHLIVHKIDDWNKMLMSEYKIFCENYK